MSTAVILHVESAQEYDRMKRHASAADGADEVYAPFSKFLEKLKASINCDTSLNLFVICEDRSVQSMTQSEFLVSEVIVHFHNSVETIRLESIYVYCIQLNGVSSVKSLRGLTDRISIEEFYKEVNPRPTLMEPDRRLVMMEQPAIISLYYSGILALWKIIACRFAFYCAYSAWFGNTEATTELRSRYCDIPRAYMLKVSLLLDMMKMKRRRVMTGRTTRRNMKRDEGNAYHKKVTLYAPSKTLSLEKVITPDRNKVESIFAEITSENDLRLRSILIVMIRWILYSFVFNLSIAVTSFYYAIETIDSVRNWTLDRRDTLKVEVTMISPLRMGFVSVLVMMLMVRELWVIFRSITVFKHGNSNRSHHKVMDTLKSAALAVVLFIYCMTAIPLSGPYQLWGLLALP